MEINQKIIATKNVTLTDAFQRVYAPLNIKFDRVVMATKDKSDWEIVPFIPEEGDPEGFLCSVDLGLNPLELQRNNIRTAQDYIVIGYVKGTPGSILAFMYLDS